MTRGIRNVRRARVAAAALLPVVLLGAACGGRSDSSSSGGGSSTTAAGTGAGGGASGLTIDTSACTGYQADQGASGDTIKIGQTLPRSGVYAVFDEVRVGIESYFKFVNDQGGVLGKKLELVSLDDGYDPARSLENAKRLVEQEKVFAMLGNVGTAHNKGIAEYLGSTGKCVPNLAVATGFPGFSDPANDPWTIGGLPSYALESAAFAKYLGEKQPEAKVALLYQNDDFGKSYRSSFNKAIEGTKISVVAEQAFDPAANTDVKSAVATLKASGADAFLIGVTALPCAQTLQARRDLGFTVTTYMSLTCTSKTIVALAGGAEEGVLSAQATYDPADPATQAEPGVAEFRAAAQKQGLEAKQVDSANVATGWGFGAYLVAMLKDAGAVDRAKVAEAAYKQNKLRYGLLLNDVTVTTDGASDPYNIESLELIKRTGGKWVVEGDLISFEGQSKKYAG